MSDNEHKRKRPRLSAAATLSKPFKSPLRTRVAPSVPLSPPDTVVTPKHEPESASVPTALNTDPKLFTSSPSLAISTDLVVSTTSQYSDPELLDLQKRYRTLFSQHAMQAKTLETAQQALRIESSGNDANLEALIIKWRLISQEAAEEVFANAQERVARMGGMKAWREHAKQDANRWESEDVGQDQAYMCDEDTEHHFDTPDDLLEKDGLRKQEEETPEEFTMEFMLKTLNIEHKAIGFDAITGRWIRH